MFDLGRTLLQTVERSPHALAIVDGKMRLTYAQWYEQIRNVAAGLATIGILPGDRLVALLQNRWEMATLHWVCQLSGIVIVPLNWRSKPEELDYCLRDADAKALVFESSSAESVFGSTIAKAVMCISLEDDDATFMPFSALLKDTKKKIVPAAEAADVSLMLYTSGTTGRPKGVPRRHRQERAAALAHVAQNLYRRGECTLGVMPLYHTMGVRSLLAMALVDGLFVCVRRWSAAQAIQEIKEHQVTCLYLVPTLYHDMLAAPGCDSEAVASVRKIGFAGAPMSDGLLGRVKEIFNPELFVNHYGSSEVYTFSVDQDAASKPGSAGRAGINTRLRVVRLDATASDQTVAAGEEGQIIVDLLGDEAFDGYWNRADANAKSLRNGWYFTGDTGYFDSDGDLFVSGRVDDMIISGGENISPFEIESVLSLHPAIDEVAVVGLPDERWGQKVVAFVKLKIATDAAALDLYCRSSDLVNFKRPREYVFVTEIPKSQVGKILRRKLTAGDYDAAAATFSSTLASSS